MAFVYAWIVPLWAAQLLPQLLMEQFDTLRIQCICMKEFIIFVCSDSAEIFFSKLKSAGLNYNFTESYCAGVSNKHCFLPFSFKQSLWYISPKSISSSGYFE